MAEYLATFDMFTSPFVYSGNLQDPSRLASALAKIAKIDRLPPDNTVGGLNALRFSWDAVDVCNRVADKMKLLTKVSYIALLVLGITIGSLTVLYLNEPHLISESTLNYLTAILALLSGLVTGIISTVNPSQKWTRLRGFPFFRCYFTLFFELIDPLKIASHSQRSVIRCCSCDRERDVEVQDALWHLC